MITPSTLRVYNFYASTLYCLPHRKNHAYALALTLPAESMLSFNYMLTKH